MTNRRFYIFLLLFCARFVVLISCQSLRTNQAALFIFGDSLFDAGNNNYINTLDGARANYWPYGLTTFKYPTGRVSDGRIIPDFIAEYAWLPLIPPYLQPGNRQFTYGVNFASAGAGALVETNQGLVINLQTQLSYFKEVEKLLRQKLGDVEAKALFSRAVYLISIGGNDYAVTFSSNSSFFHSYPKEDYVNMVIGNITTVIKEIYQVGGKKFGFLGLAQVGCAPRFRAIDPRGQGSCAEEVTEFVKLHNEALSKVGPELQSQLKGLKWAFHDLYTSSSERINNPSKYGFKYGKTACCGSGPYRGLPSCGGRSRAGDGYQLCQNSSEHVFFDSVHPTEKANQQIADLMWSGPSNVTAPYDLKTLFHHTHS